MPTLPGAGTLLASHCGISGQPSVPAFISVQSGPSCSPACTDIEILYCQMHGIAQSAVIVDIHQAQCLLACAWRDDVARAT